MSEKRRPKRAPRPGRPFFHNYRISEILKGRDKLYQILEAEFLKPGIVPHGESFIRLVQIVREEVGEVDWQTLEDSLRFLAGTTLEPGMLKDACWRIMGNIPRFKLRKVVTPWHVQTIREWVPMLVTGCQRMKNSKGKPGAMFTFRVLAGTSCPRIIVKWVSWPMCKMLARGAGFHTRFTQKEALRYPFTDARQLVGLRMYGLVDPDESDRDPGFVFPFEADEQRPGYTQLHRCVFPAGVRDYNKEQIRHTFRVDAGYVCPKGFTTALPCHLCKFGFETCRAAKHRKDWIRQPCPECKRPDAFFDPESTGAVCVECANNLKGK